MLNAKREIREGNIYLHVTGINYLFTGSVLPYMDEPLLTCIPTGTDIVDYIMSRMHDQTKSRRQVIRQLTYLDLISGAKELKQKG